jgi:hypothetical protein
MAWQDYIESSSSFDFLALTKNGRKVWITRRAKMRERKENREIVRHKSRAISEV